MWVLCGCWALGGSQGPFGSLSRAEVRGSGLVVLGAKPQANKSGADGSHCFFPLKTPWKSIDDSGDAADAWALWGSCQSLPISWNILPGAHGLPAWESRGRGQATLLFVTRDNGL